MISNRSEGLDRGQLLATETVTCTPEDQRSCQDSRKKLRFPIGISSAIIITHRVIRRQIKGRSRPDFRGGGAWDLLREYFALSFDSCLALYCANYPARLNGRNFFITGHNLMRLLALLEFLSEYFSLYFLNCYLPLGFCIEHY